MSKPLDAAKIAAIRAAAPALHNGAYTVSHPEHPQRVTLRVRTVQGGKLAGKRIIELLTGSDNERDYTGVAFWDDAEKRATVWKRFRSASPPRYIDGCEFNHHWHNVERKVAALLDLAMRGERGTWAPRGWIIQRSSRCVVCNRALTHPLSLELGLGPECASR